LERNRAEEKRRAAATLRKIKQRLTDAWIDVHHGKKAFPYLEHSRFRPENVDQPDVAAVRQAVIAQLTRGNYADKLHEYWIEPGGGDPHGRMDVPAYQLEDAKKLDAALTFIYTD
jgi:hypothetical protein